jgi:hypothetical protein
MIESESPTDLVLALFRVINGDAPLEALWKFKKV